MLLGRVYDWDTFIRSGISITVAMNKMKLLQKDFNSVTHAINKIQQQFPSHFSSCIVHQFFDIYTSQS